MNAALSSLDAALSAGPLESNFPLWRTRADALRADWLRVAPTLDDQDFSSAQSELALDLVKDILVLVERHPALAPGHGVGHARRAVTHGMILALGEGLGAADTARLLLACAAHDLGRLMLTQDHPELRHAEVSGVLVEEHLRGALMPLGRSVFLAVRQAVLMHTYVPTDEQLYFRVLDDVRICDSLDCNGTGAGFVRSAFNASAYAGLKADIPDRPLEDLDRQTYWLDDWRFRSENPKAPAVRLSAWGRTEREFRHGAGRELIAAWKNLAGDPRELVDAFCDLAMVVEPDASPADTDRATRQLVLLPAHEQARWVGILARVRADYIAEARRLHSILNLMNQGSDPILAPLAAWLLVQGVARLP